MAKLRDMMDQLHEKLKADDIFHDNEVQANRIGRLILSWNCILSLLIMVLTRIGIFPLSWNTIWAPTSQAVIEVLILVAVCRYYKDDVWWLKYLLIIGLSVVYARIDSMLTHKTAILMVIPVVFSSRYFSRNMTNFTAVFCSVLFALSAAWGAVHGMINLNIVTMDAGTQFTATGGFIGDAVINAGVDAGMLVRNTLLFDYLPKWMLFTVIAIISSNLAANGRAMILEQHESEVNAARIESELDLAKRIQADMLPNIYPAFPGRSEFDIYATMVPAKEVGGDFYDFFLIDDDHLGIAIADVSGKGVPAALFMMIAKIMVQNQTMADGMPSKVLETVNEQICRNNREEMFITIWLGVLEISTGILTAANAGHEYPIFRDSLGKYQEYRDKHGFVLGGMSGTKYKDYQIHMKPGDRLFLYTDGVVEANNARNEQFGIERTVAALNFKPDGSPVEVIQEVDRELKQFVGLTPQFDDMTMLCLNYIGPGPAAEGEQR